MENMNLASRCREAISQVASLKKEVMVYQKRQSEWGTLQREVVRLRKQLDKNAKNGTLSPNVTSNSGTSSNINHQQKQEQKKSVIASPPGSDNGLESDSSNIRGHTRGRSSPTTELDRIMSQQFRKQQQDNKATDSTAAAAGAKPATMSAVTAASANKNTSVSTGISKALSSNLTSSNTKIPINVTSSKLPSSNTSNADAASQKDDEFDADIDMVDFFTKSQSSSPSNNTGNISSSSESTGFSSTHLGSRTNHMHKPKSTDDHMPGDIISVASPSGGSMSPTMNAKKSSSATSSSSSPPTAMGDNLVSSLDAFEASFASAFPETSFSITSDPAPLTTAKLDMSFDVPDFDPFFKSPNNSTSNKQDAAAAALSSTGAGVGGNSKNSNGMKSQMVQDLFPDSTMTFKPSPKLDMAFDSNPNSMSFTPTIEKMKGPASTSVVAPEKLDTAFSRVQGARGGKAASTNNISELASSSQTKQRGLQSISAEIEQLDAIASLAAASEKSSATAVESKENAAISSGDGGDAAGSGPANNNIRSVRSSLRKVKQPVSYAEPSTKSKLRRGDVLFPKGDTTDKSKMGGPGKQTTTASPMSDLDRIMGQMTSSSDAGGQ